MYDIICGIIYFYILYAIIKITHAIIKNFIKLAANILVFSITCFCMMEVRCKHCCKSLFKDNSILVNAHYEVKQNSTDVGCQADESDCCSYITTENAPDWIMIIINQESWTKGKLHCPHCNSRLGSFNFVNDLKCNCDKYVRPPIRIINSKVDIF